MAKTKSTMLPLGTPAPDFDLPDTVSGRRVTLDAFAEAEALVVMFICNHCPYVKHIASGLARFAADVAPRSVGVVAISSNDVETHPADSPAAMAVEAKQQGYSFPYLYDESQAVAQAYQAACTPDFFLFDRGRRLVYRGQFDGARPGNDVPVTGEDLRVAVDAVLAGKPVSEDQKPSLGCNIKWKSGNAPS